MKSTIILWPTEGKWPKYSYNIIRLPKKSGTSEAAYQATYYSRQVYLNNFCIVKGHSKSNLSPENATAYIWTKNEFWKGANENSSCLFEFLNTVDMTPYTIVRLVCDGLEVKIRILFWQVWSATGFWMHPPIFRRFNWCF